MVKPVISLFVIGLENILSMLESKTEGNLTKEEENMLKNILYDLRILFVKESCKRC